MGKLSKDTAEGVDDISVAHSNTKAQKALFAAVEEPHSKEENDDYAHCDEKHNYSSKSFRPLHQQSRSVYIDRKEESETTIVSCAPRKTQIRTKTTSLLQSIQLNENDGHDHQQYEGLLSSSSRGNAIERDIDWLRNQLLLLGINDSR